MAESQQEWVEGILARDRRAIARALTAIEGGDAPAHGLLKELFPKTGRAYVVGVTGWPGAGKSTLVEKLAADYRRSGLQVGILAVDPTSPFSGGALLGDRIRMASLSTDDGVYIRSMATRGHLGGLAPTTHDAVTVLDAAGYEVVIVETVGVGQDEVDVARLAEVTVLLVVPGMGDDVQTFKAGVMEIADLFVINKADRPGVDRVEQEVAAMLAIAPAASGWRPPILKTVATTGEGVNALRQALDEFHKFGDQTRLRAERQREHWRLRLLELVRQGLFEKVLRNQLRDEAMERHVEDILSRRRDPYSVVEELVKDLTPHHRKSTKRDP